MFTPMGSLYQSHLISFGAFPLYSYRGDMILTLWGSAYEEATIPSSWYGYNFIIGIVLYWLRGLGSFLMESIVKTH